MNGTRWVATFVWVVSCVIAVACDSSGGGGPSLHDPAQIELGRHLFYERRLSLHNDRSCGICHEQAKGFTDGFVRAVGTTGDIHMHNTLGLLNGAFRETRSWSAPTPISLAEHMRIPLLGTDPVEMGAGDSIDAMIAELNADPVYWELLDELTPPRPSMDLELILEATGEFVRTLVDYESPYDHFLAGESSALTAKEKAGRDLFFSEQTGCGDCHGGADFDEPSTGRHGWVNTGLYNLANGSYPFGRQGLFEWTGKPEDTGKVRIPTLRHLAFTAPYYHDGSGASLADVLRNYNAGGRRVESGPYAGDGRENPFKDPRVRPLGLTDSELEELEAFLLSLSNPGGLERADWADPWPREEVTPPVLP